MTDKKIAAIILSAGYSSRMHSFKPLLKFGECTAIEILVDTFKSSGIEEIVVVSGHRASEVSDRLKHSGILTVINEDYAKGMYTSVVKGVENLSDRVKAFFLIPVDIPLVKKYTLFLMESKYKESNKGIIYPVYKGKRGHPPLIDIKYKQDILKDTGEGGLRKVLSRFHEDSEEISLFDSMIIADMDKKEDYELLLDYYKSGTLSPDEAYAILEYYNISRRIIEHSDTVRKVSLDILAKLMPHIKLNKATLEAAALLHDIAKGEKNHAKKGELLLKEIGYEDIGRIISTHTDIDVNIDSPITEEEVLYLADKLVKEDKIITLKERKEISLKSYEKKHEILININKRFDDAIKIIKKIEMVTGERFEVNGKEDLSS